MGVFHDRTALDVAVFLEKTRNFCFRETRMDSSDEKIGAGVASTRFTLVLATVGRRATTWNVS